MQKKIHKAKPESHPPFEFKATGTAISESFGHIEPRVMGRAVKVEKASTASSSSNRASDEQPYDFRSPLIEGKTLDGEFKLYPRKAFRKGKGKIVPVNKPNVDKPKSRFTVDGDREEQGGRHEEIIGYTEDGRAEDGEAAAKSGLQKTENHVVNNVNGGSTRRSGFGGQDESGLGGNAAKKEPNQEHSNGIRGFGGGIRGGAADDVKKIINSNHMATVRTRDFYAGMQDIVFSGGHVIPKQPAITTGGSTSSGFGGDSSRKEPVRYEKNWNNANGTATFRTGGFEMKPAIASFGGFVEENNTFDHKYGNNYQQQRKKQYNNREGHGGYKNNRNYGGRSDYSENKQIYSDKRNPPEWGEYRGGRGDFSVAGVNNSIPQNVAVKKDYRNDNENYSKNTHNGLPAVCRNPSHRDGPPCTALCSLIPPGYGENLLVNGAKIDGEQQANWGSARGMENFGSKKNQAAGREPLRQKINHFNNGDFPKLKTNAHANGNVEIYSNGLVTACIVDLPQSGGLNHNYTGNRGNQMGYGGQGHRENAPKEPLKLRSSTSAGEGNQHTGGAPGMGRASVAIGGTVFTGDSIEAVSAVTATSTVLAQDSNEEKRAIVEKQLHKEASGEQKATQPNGVIVAPVQLRLFEDNEEIRAFIQKLPSGEDAAKLLQ